MRREEEERIVAKVNEYMSRRDYAGVERHLLYWLNEAKANRDLRGELFVRNELIGHFRKTDNEEEGVKSIEEALRLLELLDLTQSITAGTVYINAATAYLAFDKKEEAYPLFVRAKDLYEGNEQTEGSLLGGLYNNMAICSAATGRYQEAFDLYEKALTVMQQIPGGELEQAMTYLNMADAVSAMKDPADAEKQIFELLDRATEQITDPGIPHDGYYAFVCEKCTPVFAHYGYFRVADQLKKQSEEIYSVNGNA